MSETNNQGENDKAVGQEQPSYDDPSCNVKEQAEPGIKNQGEAHDNEELDNFVFDNNETPNHVQAH
ncbi:MAG: hypothetical protein ACKO7B_09910 [Flavobacteriales bacterium]